MEGEAEQGPGGTSTSTEQEERKGDQSDGNQKNLHGPRPVTFGFVMRQNASPVFRRTRQDRALRRRGPMTYQVCFARVCEPRHYPCR